MKDLQDLITSVMRPLTVWSEEAILEAALNTGVILDERAGRRQVADALRDDSSLVRRSDGRYARAAGILTQGPLTARCVEVLTALVLPPVVTWTESPVGS